MSLSFNRIENSGLRYLLIFMIINLVNDYWSIKIGIPTLNHLFIIYLFIKMPYPYKYGKQISPLIIALALYLLVIFVNSIFTLGKYGENLNFISVILKISVIILMVPHFINVTKNDFTLFVKYLNLALIFFVLIPGVYEWRTQTNIMQFGSGLSQFVFYLRAFSIDKVDFGFNLILLISTSLIRLQTISPLYKLLHSIIIVFSLMLLVFSFSTTNLVGIGISSILYFIFYSKNKIFSAGAIILMVIIVFINTTIMHDIFENKYSYQESEIGDKEFRSVAFIESLVLFSKSPFVGYGSESNGYLLQEQISWLNKPLSSHNFMSEFVNYGIIGGLPILFSFYFILKRVFLLRKYRSDVILLILFLTGPMISRLLFYFHRFDKSLYVVWFSLGVILIYNYKSLYESNRNNS